MTNTTTYGQQVRKARNLKDYSQEALAIAAGVSKRTIQNVEAGGNPGPETKRALASVLGEALTVTTQQDGSVPEFLYAQPNPIGPVPAAVFCGAYPSKPSSDRIAAPRRLTIGQRISGETSWGSGLVGAFLRMMVLALIWYAVIFGHRYLYEPDLWITVQARYQGLTPEQEASNLSETIALSFPDIRHVEFLSATTEGPNARRVFSAVAHGTDPAALSAFLAQLGTAAEVTTVKPDP